MNKLISILIILLPLIGASQNFVLDNEHVILEFKTLKGKRMVVAEDTSGNYLIYRYGTTDNIELEYPSDHNDSWNKFLFSYDLRGGGIRNEGIDLNYLYFTIDKFKYVVFQEYSAHTEKTEYGIKVINKETKETINLKADPNTVSGSLGVLRDNRKMKEGEELFK